VTRSIFRKALDEFLWTFLDDRAPQAIASRCPSLRALMSRSWTAKYISDTKSGSIPKLLTL
jgi:hypothetical protein